MANVHADRVAHMERCQKTTVHGIISMDVTQPMPNALKNSIISMGEQFPCRMRLYMANYGWWEVTQATIVRQHNFDEGRTSCRSRSVHKPIMADETSTGPRLCQHNFDERPTGESSKAVKSHPYMLSLSPSLFPHPRLLWSIGRCQEATTWYWMAYEWHYC